MGAVARAGATGSFRPAESSRTEGIRFDTSTPRSGGYAGEATHTQAQHPSCYTLRRQTGTRFNVNFVRWVTAQVRQRAPGAVLEY